MTWCCPNHLTALKSYKTHGEPSVKPPWVAKGATGLLCLRECWGAGCTFLTTHIDNSSELETFEILWGKITSLVYEVNPRDKTFSSSRLTLTQMSWLPWITGVTSHEGSYCLEWVLSNLYSTTTAKNKYQEQATPLRFLPLWSSFMLFPLGSQTGCYFPTCIGQFAALTSLQFPYWWWWIASAMILQELWRGVVAGPAPKGLRSFKSPVVS